MIHGQATKDLIVIAPAAIVDNAAYTTVQIDTLGFEYCEIIVAIGASDIAMVALKVQESDTDGSNFTDVTGLVYGTSVNTAGATSTLPTDGSDGTLFKFEIDLRGRKRYLDLVATAGDGSTGTFASATARLSRAKNAPDTATEQGAAQVLRL